ncbi:hypothetical protein [Limnoglobus roseus]|uniref:Uncharacterized protein n=1 Tax=Limnoglobus roseus TaxID=2598579 RepID=A0A5C1AIG9_9BACT|nr:hypothetical protein [Limnoglobus roseus]QEL17472.1 hypothetical protein PX52LOC_04461 [Limnoglobus roseus]
MIAYFKRQAHAFVVGGCILSVIGIASAIYLPGRRDRANALSVEAQRITLADLAANGPGGNRHVIVTDYDCAPHFAYEITPSNADSEPGVRQEGQGRAWLPLFKKTPPTADPEAEPTAFVVLLETTPTSASGAGFRLLSRKREMEGVVFPLPQRGLLPEVRGHLANDYPDTDFSACWLLEQFEPREKDDAPFFADALLVGTVVGLVFGPPAVVAGLVWDRQNMRKSRRRRNRAE